MKVWISGAKIIVSWTGARGRRSTRTFAIESSTQIRDVKVLVHYMAQGETDVSVPIQVDEDLVARAFEQAFKVGP